MNSKIQDEVAKFKNDAHIKQFIKNNIEFNQKFDQLLKLDQKHILEFYKKQNHNTQVLLVIKIVDLMKQLKIINQKLNDAIVEQDEQLWQFLKCEKISAICSFEPKINDMFLKKIGDKQIDKICKFIITHQYQKIYYSYKSNNFKPNLYSKKKFLNLCNKFNDLFEQKSILNAKRELLIGLLNDVFYNNKKIHYQKSKKETIIFNYLKNLQKSNNLLLIIDEKKFLNLRNKRDLRYDFFGLIENNKKLIIPFIIEYDGKQHWTGYGKTNRLYFNKNDIIKEHFAKINGISMLRISYKCKNIILTINEFFGKLKNVNYPIYEFEHEKLYRERDSYVKLHLSK